MADKLTIELVEKTIQNVDKSVRSSAEKSITDKLLKELIKESKANNIELPKSFIDALSKGISSEVSKLLDKLERNINKLRPSGQGPAAVNKSNDKIIREGFNALLKSIQNSSKAADVKLNVDSLKGLFNEFRKSLDMKGYQAEIIQLKAALGRTTSTIEKLIRKTDSNAKSGGKLDLSELATLTTDIKTLKSGLGLLKNIIGDLTSTYSKLKLESQELIKNLKEASSSYLKETKNKVSNARALASQAISKSPQESATTVVNALKKYGFDKDPNIAKIVKILESSGGKDVAVVAKAIGELKPLLVDIAKNRESKIAGFDKLVNVLSNLAVAVDNINKNSKNNDTSKNITTAAAKKAAALSPIAQSIKLIVDDSNIKEAMKEIPKEVTTKLAIDTSDASKQIDKAVPKEVQSKLSFIPDKKEVDIYLDKLDSYKAHPKIEPILMKIKASLAKQDFADARRLLEDVIQTKDIEIGIDTKGFFNEFRKVVNYLESKKLSVSPSVSERVSPQRPKQAPPQRIQPTQQDRKIESDILNKKKNMSTSEFAGKFFRPETVIKPGKYVDTAKMDISIPNMSKQGQKIAAATKNNLNKLSDSLLKLQTNVITELEKELNDLKSSWKVVRPEGSKPHQAFSLGNNNRQWSAQLVDVGRLKKTYGIKSDSPEKVLEAFKSIKISKISSEISNDTARAERIGRWLNQSTEDAVKKIDIASSATIQQLLTVKKSIKGSEIGNEVVDAIKKILGSGEKLKTVFEKSYASSEAERSLVSERAVKKVSLPTAVVSELGSANFKTTYGTERALPKFATYETGFESLYKKMQSLVRVRSSEEPGDVKNTKNTLGKEIETFTEGIKSVGIRQETVEKKQQAEKLAKEMLNATAKIFSKTSSQKEGATFLRSAYKDASFKKAFDLQEQGLDTADSFINKFNSKVKEFDSLDVKDRTFKKFSDSMDQLGLTALDVVKNMDNLNFKNVYDVMNDVVASGKKRSPIKVLAKEVGFERGIREFEKAISEVEGLMPVTESNKPRRGYHQESVINLMTRTAPYYDIGYRPGAKSDRLYPDDQKTLIKDLNIEINRMLKRNQQTVDLQKKLGVLDSKNLSKLSSDFDKVTSLGVPESQASNVMEYREGPGGQGKYLRNLNVTSVKMAAGDLTALAPFQQFQQAGRNISNITNAIVGLGSKLASTPKLQSEEEKGMIEAGRYGKAYGFNVVSELRTTAANFEDQIVIGGRLAKELTTATKILVKPSPSGVVAGTEAEKALSSGVTKISDIDKVTKEYMKILGVSERYKGRSDEALISEVKDTISVVRGQDVNVQVAKLTETFLNYFGRKFTTRYGSKGVSVTPTGIDQENILDILGKYQGKKIKVDERSALGYQVSPKSMGELASEMFGGNISDEFRAKLKESGNKFMISLFQEIGPNAIIPEEEALTTKKLYDDFSKKWQEVFKSPVPTPDIKGIENFKKTYLQSTGGTKESLTKVKPIDIRISSYGAAKRGLQTEFMEVMMNNIIGGTGKTTLKQFTPEAYNKLLSTGKAGGNQLSEYSKVLGYSGSDKKESEIAQDLFEKFGGTKAAKKAGISDKVQDLYDIELKNITDESKRNKVSKVKEIALLSKRAAAIESSSSFYSTVVDEFGKERKGLVGEKFVQIVEDSGKNPEWQRGQIERGTKGARLNIPAYSAYATVFGEQSKFLEELKKSLDVNAKKHWEYLKALQTIQDKDSEVYKSLTEDLKSVDISQVKPFYEHTGVPGDEKHPRSFVGTVLDTSKFPEPFKLKIPTGKYGKENTPQMEDFYVPGALARSTYPETLLAGEHGMDDITRRLTTVINMASELETLMNRPEEAIDVNKVEDSLKKTIGSLTAEASKLGGLGANKSTAQRTPEDLDRLEDIFKQLYSALSTTSETDPNNVGSRMKEVDFVNDQIKKQLAKVGPGAKTRHEAMATVIGSISDVLIGKLNQADLPEKERPMTSIKRAKEQGNLASFATQLGVDVIGDKIDTKIKSLQKAKIDYYNSLAEASTGKTGSVNELFFSRKIPAVIAKATTAVVDKTDDLSNFKNKLIELETKYGDSFSEYIKELPKISEEHEKAIRAHRKAGIPVLKQTEIGVPKGYAEKIPVEFIKKYLPSKDAGGGVKPIKSQKVSGSLYSMMKYAEELKRSASDTGQVDEIRKYIEEDLAPYIESIRFPFTGTSSIAPFKPKLIDPGKYRTETGENLAQNVLVAPGIPAGLEGIVPIIDKLKDKLESLGSTRERMYEMSAPQEEIDKLTAEINDLSAAISDVIPKYTSQAQKLDFDGDQIEIHSSKLLDARKEIGTHFQKFHFADTSKPSTTSDIFRTKFLSDAADLTKVGETGQYVFGEAQRSFEKKFPVQKGFEFLKTPFLNEDLDYLSPEKALNVLSGTKEFPTPESVVKSVLEMQNVQDATISKIVEAISGLDTTDDKYTDNIMAVIKEKFGEVYNGLTSGIKTKLKDEKVKDTVEAQLYKVHTGMETEALYRVHRLVENAVGFGGGELGKSSGTSSKYMKGRYPSGLKVMAERPEEELHTMMNELTRFGIQKGMDVKHAGEKPVAGELVNYLSRGKTGAQELWGRISDKKDKTFSDLADFAEANTESIKMRIGALPTDEIMSEAKKIATSRGESTDLISTMDRKNLIDYIIKAVGFEGFLTELSELIKNEAIKGLAMQASKWTEGKKAKPGMGLKPVKGDINEWARQSIEEQISKGGINIKQSIMDTQSPLYAMRSLAASPAEEYKKYMASFGNIAVPEEEISKLQAKELEEYKDKFKRAKATAVNVQQELGAFAKSSQGGAYADMLRSSVSVLHEQQNEIAKYVTGISKEGYNPEKAKSMDLVERVTNKSIEGVSTFANDIISMNSNMNSKLEDLSDLAGIPMLSDIEKFNIDATTRKKFTQDKTKLLEGSGKSSKEIQQEADEYADSMIEKAQALKQLDKVIDAFIGKKGEGVLIQSLMPKGMENISEYSSYNKEQQEYYSKFKEFKAQSKRSLGDVNYVSKKDADTILGTTPPKIGGDMPTGMPYSGGPIPVHIVSADSSVTINVRGLKAGGYIPSTGTPNSEELADKILNAFNKKISDIEDRNKVETTLTRIKPKTIWKEETTYENTISPSSLRGGGTLYSKEKGSRPFIEEQRLQEQVEELVKFMTEKPAPIEGVHADWGTLVHAKLEKAIKATAQNVDTEKYGEITDSELFKGTLGGFADLIEYKDTDKTKISKVVDIKTKMPETISKLEKAIKEAGSENINDVIEKADDSLKRELHDMLSQVNSYLKIFDEAAEGEIRFYDRMKGGKDINDYVKVRVKFGPDRFKKDMAQLEKARGVITAPESEKSFRSTWKSDRSEVAPENMPSTEEIDSAINILKEKYKSEAIIRVSNTKVSRLGSSEKNKERMRKGAETEREQYKEAEARAKSMPFNNLADDELARSIVPPPIVIGTDAESFLANIKLLQDQAKLFQKSIGVSEDSLQSVSEAARKPLLEAIGSVKEKGPDYESFIKLTKSLQEITDEKDQPLLSSKKMMESWKLYRIAVGDWFINKAEEAQKQAEELKAAGDMREYYQARGQFNTRVTNLQEFVRRSAGKKTDVYTHDKRYVYPAAAQAAGVYMSPEQIMKKAGEPLGEGDQKLINTFKNITNSISKELPIAPKEMAADLFKELSSVNSEMIKLLSNTEKFGRMGTDVADIGGDFDQLGSRVTRLRAALQQVVKNNKEMTAEQAKSLDTIIKYLKAMEGMYSGMNFGENKTGYGQMNLTPVPKFIEPEMQKGLYASNIQKVREYFKKPAEEGGPAVGEGFNYTEKVVGRTGEVIKNVIHHFEKYGEVLTDSGRIVGQFSESQKDLINKMSQTGSTFGNAVRRVIMWGAASRLVYGGISELKSSLGELANIEMGIAQLRMVMNPLETDFGRMSKSAAGLAKQYGVPVTDILKSMKVFAQQGLKQEDVIDRTQTATLASNVSTLNAKEATEALTAAMVSFREEGTQSMRFLDAWSEVESKYAITADDLANATKKSAAAAKAAGFNFDQLNGIVTAIGAVTRQTGNEVGTSLRFIFKSLFSEKGPKELAKLEIPTITGSGELRSGFDILGDLAGKWKDLSSAQRLNIAQAIAGTRQYNALLVLMDQWDSALGAVTASTDSKGSAERRNAEIMKTYAKQLEQTKAAATELKMEFGKIALPIFKSGLKGLQVILETLTAIPMPIKMATTALAGFFALGAKGIDIFDTIGEGFNKSSAAIDDFKKAFSDQMGIAKYEITGKAGKNTDVFGLKTLTKQASSIANIGKAGDVLTKTTPELAKQGMELSDFHSVLGKSMFMFMKWGQSYNEMIGNMISKTGDLSEKVGEGAQSVGAFMSTAVGVTEGTIGGVAGPTAIYKGLKKAAEMRGLGKEAVKGTIKELGIGKGLMKILGKSTMLAGEIGGAATYLTGQAIDSVGEQLGAGGRKFAKDFATNNAGLIKSLAPLALTMAALIPTMKGIAEYFSKMSGNAKDFEMSVAAIRQKNEDQLKSVRDLVTEYDALESKVKDINKTQDPKTKSRRQELGTYESPLTSLQKVQERSLDLGNRIAEANINMVMGYDKLGNAVLRTSDNYKSFLKNVERINLKKGIGTELEVLGKHVDDLTKGSKSEKTKAMFKEMAESFPLIGGMLSKNIKLSPAKALEMASEDLNKRLNLKQKYPMATAADTDIKKMQETLSKARGLYKEAYGDMKKVYSGILSPNNLKGLGKDDIENILRSPELKKAYELQIEIDPKFRLVSGVTWQDVMGKEFLSALNPKTAGILDVTSEFTKANVESLGIKSRSGKTASGDVVTFYKDFADKYNIAGQQAIVKLKDTDEWVVEYFNTRTLKIEETPLSEVEGMVDGIFPLQKIKEDLAYRMDALNTFVAGAGAGLSGISKSAFKKDFSLGERFFGELPTTTLLQGNKGFSPGTGYGNVEAMKNFKNDIDEYYFKPMEELKLKMEQVEKLKLEGLEESDVALSKDFYDEINKLLDVLKNNQVVLQFRAVFVDLMKEMANGQRVLKEDIAVMKRRAEVDKVSAGLTAGMPIGLENIDLGVRELKDITPRQQLLTRDPAFRDMAVQLRSLESTSQSTLDMIDKFERAQVQIDDIMDVAKGFGAIASPKRMSELIEKVVPEREDGPFHELKQVNQDIEKNTSNTVNKLDAILENMGDPETINKQLKSWTDNISIGGDSKITVEALERVAGLRSKAEKRGDQEAVNASNKALDILTKQLITQVGYKKGIEMVDNNFTLFSKKFKPEEFQQRAFGGIDTEEFLDKMKKYGSNDKSWYQFWKKQDISKSSEYKDFTDIQQKQYQEGLFSSKNIARVAAMSTVLSQVQQSGNRGIIKKIDEQIQTTDTAIEKARTTGAGAKELSELLKRREGLVSKKSEKESEAQFYGSVKSISGTSFAITELAKAAGLTEKQIKYLDAGAVGLYASFKLASSILGEDLPKSAKAFGKDLEELAVKAYKGEEFSTILAASKVKESGSAMVKDFNARTKEIFKGKAPENLVKKTSNIDISKLSIDLDKSIKERNAAIAAFKGKDAESPRAQYADLQMSLNKAILDVDRSGKSDVEKASDKDTIRKEYDYKIKSLLNTLGREDKDSITSDWAKLNKSHPVVTSSISDELSKALGSEIANVGDILTRGLEKAEAPSKIKQLVLAYLATAVSDYASNKSSDKTALNSTEVIMKEQSNRLAELIEKYPEAAEAALKDLNNKANNAKDSIGTITTIDKPLTQDANKAKEDIKKQLQDIQDAYIKEQQKLTEERIMLQNKLADKERRETLNNLLQSFARNELERIDNSKIDRRFSLTNILNKTLAGYSGDVTLPLSERDMSTQQRSYSDIKAKGDNSYAILKALNPVTYFTSFFKLLKPFMNPFTTAMGDLNDYDPKKILAPVITNVKELLNPKNYGIGGFRGFKKDPNTLFLNKITAYADALEQSDTLRSNLKALQQNARQEQYIIGTTKDKTEKSYAKERLVEINKHIETLTNNIEDFSEKLRKIGELHSVFQQFESSVFKLKDALRDIGIQESVESIKGFREYKDNFDKLLGGSHPDAVISISPEDERMASKVGIDLHNLLSNQWDLLEAQLKNRLKESSGQEAYNIRQQLIDLPLTRERKLQERDQTRYDDILRRRMQPYEEQLYSLESLRQTPNISNELKDRIRALENSNVEMLKHSADRIPTDVYKKQLTSAKDSGKITGEEYNRELERVRDLNTKYIYKADSILETKQNSKITDDIKELMKRQILEAPSPQGLEMDALVTSPIVDKINETNDILTMILGKETGMDLNSSIMDRLSERLEKITSKSGSGKSSNFKGIIETLLGIFKPIEPPKGLAEKAKDAPFKYIDSLFGLNSRDKSSNFKDGGVFPTNTVLSGPGTKTSDSLLGRTKENSFILKGKAVDKMKQLGIYKNIIGNSKYYLGGNNKDNSLVALSRGEVVIPPEDVKRNGIDFYSFLNENGYPPNYIKAADGGPISDWAIKHPNLYGLFGAGKALWHAATDAESWKEAIGYSGLKRLWTGESQKAGWGQYTADTINSFLTLMPFAGKAMSAGARGLEGIGVALTKNSGKMLSTEIRPDLAMKGYESLRPVATKISKFSAEKQKELSKVFSNEYGSIMEKYNVIPAKNIFRDEATVERYKAVLDTLSDYDRIFGEIGGAEHVAGVAVGIDTKAFNKTFLGRSEAFSDLNLGIHFGPETSVNLGKKLTNPTKLKENLLKGKNFITLDKSLFKPDIDVSEAAHAAKHELGHHFEEQMVDIARASNFKNIGLDDLVRKYADVSYGLEEHIVNNMQGLPTEYAYTNSMEGFAETFAHGPKTNKLGENINTLYPKMEELMTEANKPYVMDRVKEFKNVINGQKRQALMKRIENKYFKGEVGEDYYNSWRKDISEISFAEGGFVDKVVNWAKKNIFNIEDPEKSYFGKLTNEQSNARQQTLKELGFADGGFLGDTWNWIKENILNLDPEKDQFGNLLKKGSRSREDVLRETEKFAFGGLKDSKNKEEEGETLIKKWGISTLHDVADRMKTAAAPMGDFDINKVPENLRSYVSYDSMGITPDKMTNRLLIGANASKKFNKDSKEYAKNAKFIRDKEYSIQLDDLEFDKRRNLYIYKRDNKLVGGIQAKYPTLPGSKYYSENYGVRSINGPASYKDRALGQVEKGGRSELFVPSNLPNVDFLDKLSKSAEATKRALAIEGLPDKDREELTGSLMDLNSVLLEASTSKNLLNKDFQKRAASALNNSKGVEAYSRGYRNKVNEDKLKEAGLLFDRSIAPDLYKNILGRLDSTIPITKSEVKDFQEKIGIATSDYNKYYDTKYGLTGLKDKDKQKIKDIIKSQQLADAEKHFSNMTTFAKKISSPFSSLYNMDKEDMMRLIEYSKTKYGIDYGTTKSTTFEDLSSKFSKLISKYGNFNSNNNSDMVMHHGGIVPKTGRYFMKGGEVVLPHFADGGPQIATNFQPQSLNSTGAFDLSSIFSKLENIKLDVEAKVPELKEPTWKVEVEKPDWGIKVDMPESGIKVDMPESGIKVDMPESGIKVDMPESGIKVDMPKDALEIMVNVDDAKNALSDAIKSALSTEIKIKVDSSDVVTRAAGADRFDELAKTVEAVNDKIINVNKNLKDEIKVLADGRNKETSVNIEGKINASLEAYGSSIKKDINDLRNDIGQIQSDQRGQASTIEYKFADLEYKLSLVRNGIGSRV